MKNNTKCQTNFVRKNKLASKSVDPRTRSSPVAPAAGRSPITHSHSTANRINHTLYDIHSYNNTQAFIARGNYKESGVVTSPTLTVNTQAWTAGWTAGWTMGGVGCFPFHHVFNATMGRHCFTTLSTTKIYQICAGFW